jgi:hypothetical protein
MEIWENIKNYENYYQISNLGRVKSLARFDNMNRKISEKILNPRKDKKNYYGVALNKNGETKYFKIHRLVGIHFIDNPNNLPQINHKDENKQNNCVDNLEWCTNQYNCSYGTKADRMLKTKGQQRVIKKETKDRKIPILQYDLDNNFIKEWICAKYVKKELNIDNSDIAKCCKGQYKQVRGFIWAYKTQIGV